jgi:anti-sigma factor RsiW
VAQLHDKHLTTEQLSASYDKQLSSEEQAVFNAHLSTCQQCQRHLADLRLTVALLHALPEEEAPRSFVLPENLSFVPERTIQQIPVPQKQRVRFNTLRRSIRVVSTLAAVLALFFIISGILPFMHFGGANNSASTATSSSSSGEANRVHPVVTTPGVSQTDGAHPQVGATTSTPPPVPTQTLSPTGAATSKTSHGIQSTDQSPTVPPLLDPGHPAGRLSLGVLLLALSIISLIITRRRRLTLNE